MTLEYGDVILINIDGEDHVFAKVLSCLPDLYRPPGWYRMRMLALFVPPKESTWILTEEDMSSGSFRIEGHDVSISVVQPDDSEKEPPVLAEVIDLTAAKEKLKNGK